MQYDIQSDVHQSHNGGSAMHFKASCIQLFFRVTLAVGFTGTYPFFQHFIHV